MSNEIEYEDFAKMQLRVAEIVKAEEIEGKDKLLKLSLKVGKESRTIVAGIKPYYPIKELKGKKIIIIANLAPRKLAGITSEGMLLAASNKDNKLSLLTVDKDIESGSSIS